jgi:hypothetical protein
MNKGVSDLKKSPINKETFPEGMLQRSLRRSPLDLRTFGISLLLLFFAFTVELPSLAPSAPPLPLFLSY